MSHANEKLGVRTASTLARAEVFSKREKVAFPGQLIASCPQPNFLSLVSLFNTLYLEGWTIGESALN
jgi:hypothetical protein